MKKSNLAIILLCALVICTAICLISCDTSPDDTPDINPTHVHDYDKDIDGNTFTLKCSCGEKITDGYRIQFVYAEDGSPANPDIEVTWTDAQNNAYTAKTDTFGYVEAPQLTADSYKISVKESTLPVINGVSYSYNSGAFKTQTKGVGLIIPLIAIYQPNNASDSAITGRLVDSLGETNLADRYQIDLNKTYIVTLNNASDKVWYTLQNDGVGKYTVDATMAGDVTIEMDRHAANIAYLNQTPDSKVDKTQKNKLTYTVVYSDATQDSTFCFSAPEATSYPVSFPFTVTITYVPENKNVDSETLVVPTFFETVEDAYTYYTTDRGDSTPIPQTTPSFLPALGVAKCADKEGAVISNFTAAEQLEGMLLHDDGYYYTADNKLIYAKIATTSILENLTLKNYLDEAESLKFHIYTVVEMDADYGYYTRNDNYFGFVQAYAALTNSDGLYPLTDEMFAYLKEVAKKEHAEVYQLLCTYPVQINNFSEGQGTESNPYVLTLSDSTLGNYNVSISAGSKVYVQLNGTMEITLSFNSNVKATVNSSAYSDYIEVDGSKTLVLETKDGSALDFVLHVEKYENLFYLEVGGNTRALEADKLEKYYEFIAPSAGTYELSVAFLHTEETLTVTVSKTYDDAKATVVEGDLAITLNAGETLYFTASSTAAAEFEIIINVKE